MEKGLWRHELLKNLRNLNLSDSLGVIFIRKSPWQGLCDGGFMNFQAFLKAAFISIFFASQSLWAASNLKIGFVDVQRAIEGTSLGKDAIGKMKSKVEALNKELEKKKSDLKKMGEDLKRKQAVLTEDVLRTKQGEYQQEMMKVSQFAQTGQIDLQKREKELMDPIIKKLKTVIDEVANKEKFAMVLNQTPQNPAVLFATKEVDLTQKVITAFEKKFKTKKK